MPTYKENLHLGTKDPVIGGDDLAEGIIRTLHLEDGAVTTPKIANGAVTWDKLSTYVQRLILSASGMGDTVKEVFVFAGSYTDYPEDAVEGLRIYLTPTQKFYVWTDGEWVEDDPLSEALYVNSADGLLYRWTDGGLVSISSVNIVSMDDLDGLTGASLSRDPRSVFYAVTCPMKGGAVVDGVLLLFSDNLGHSNTQVLVTHRVLNSDGSISEAHNDNAVSVYWRAYGLSTHPTHPGTWSQWQYLVPDYNLLDGRFVSIETILSGLRSRLDTDYNLSDLVKMIEDVSVDVSSGKPGVAHFGDIVVNAVTVSEVYSGDDGEVVYCSSQGIFIFRRKTNNGNYIYYAKWVGCGPYYDDTKTAPRTDVVYAQTDAGGKGEVLYLYNPSLRSLVAVNTGGGGGSTEADGITITKKTIDGVEKIAMADNTKTSSNTVGTVLLTTDIMPSSVGDTRYALYKDINFGNQSRETPEGGEPLPESISLAPGSKLVPNGGMPKVVDEHGSYLSPMPVEGGELSWVHSSDIGMIQDGQLPKGMTREDVGVHNANVLRMVAVSRWNLILDGTYYVNVGRADGTSSVVSGEEGRRNARLNAVIVSRPLRIRGGGLIAELYLFCVEPGGGLVMEDVMLDNLSNYQMIYVDADGALVDSVELYRCSLKTSASPTGTDKYAKNGRFIGGKARNAGNVDTVNDLMPNGLSKQFNTTNCKTILGMSDNEGGLGSRFGQKSATATEPSQLLVYPLGQVFPGDSESSRSAAECAYDMWSQLYVPQAGGGYVFKERSGSTTKHFGMYGDFVPTPDNLTGVYKENGEVVYYAPMYVHDTYENGVIIRGANPEVEHNGLRRLIIEDCTVMCQSTAIEMGGMEVTDEFRIHGCRFYNILALAVNFGTSNDEEAADDWASRSCPLEVSGNTFKGPGEMHVTSSSTIYACALLYEGDKVVFADNVIEDIVTTTTTYDCYLSCNNLEYRGNVIRNVLNWKNGKKLYGYMKAKKEKINAVYRARWRDTPAAHPMKMSRVYEGNRFEVNLKDVRRLCDWYMEENRASLLPDYQDTAWDEVPQEAKDGVLREYVLKTMFDNIVSTWAFDSYVIRDNVFDWPDCRVDGASLSGGQARVRRWVFSGNVLKGLSFCNTQADGYDKYLFAIQCLDEGTDVEIVGNRFESKGHEVINLLCANDQKALDSLRVEDNTFVECGYRIAQKGRLQGGTYYDGVLVAGKVRIRGNEEAVGLDRGFTGPYYYDVTQYFAQKGLPVMYCGLGGEDDITEVWDSQAAGVAAQTGKMVLLPIGKGRFALHSRHLCRPMQKDGDGIPVLDGDCSLSLINSFMVRNSNGTIAPDSKGYAINISYCVRGRWRERKMELRCVPFESALRGVSVRGVDGVRWVHSRTYPVSGGPAYNKVYYTDLTPVEDLGLHFLLSHRSIVASNKSYSNYGAPMIRLALYTDAGGTLNDPGTVITIRVSDIAANVDMPWVKPATQSEEAVPNTIQYGATSPFETFLPKGSALTSAERTALKTADYCLYKGEPDESQGRRSSTLLAADAGWWCVDPGSGQIVTWTGSKWSDEPEEESE